MTVPSDPDAGSPESISFSSVLEEQAEACSLVVAETPVISCIILDPKETCILGIALFCTSLNPHPALGFAESKQFLTVMGWVSPNSGD